jgi:hypothetical protein
MREYSFTKLGNTYHFTDYLIVGIETKRHSGSSVVDRVFEKIERFCIIHCKPNNGRLSTFTALTEFEGCDILETVLKYYPCGKRTLIICNNSLVFLGSSDLTDLLENKIYKVATGTEDGENVGLPEKDRISTLQFIASAPPTIVGLESKLNSTRITIVDIANYGVKDIGDFALMLDAQYYNDIPNYAELGLSIDKCDTVTTCIHLIFNKYYTMVMKHGLGGIALTYSGQAIRSFRKNNYENGIKKHADEVAATVEEACYFAGRAESRYRGWYRGKCYLLDLNSLYPHVGRNTAVPCELVKTIRNPKPRILREAIENYCGFAHVRVSTSQAKYPCRVDGCLKWPTGTFNTFLCGKELKEAVESGDVIDCYFLATYRTGMILKSYSEDMLDIRSQYKRNGDKVSEHLIKFITNGLWGMLGSLGNRWIVDHDAVSTSRYGGFVRLSERGEYRQIYRVIDGECSKQVRCSWSDNTFTPISAFINSACRALLWRYMLQAQLSNVLYCAIDGLIVTEDGYRNLKSVMAQDQFDYGYFKVAESDHRCYIHSAGRYSIGEKVAYTGMPRKDSYIYKGFWNIRDEKYILDQQTGHRCTLLQNRGNPSLLRQTLGSDDNQLGWFTCPDELAERKLQDDSVYQRDNRPSQHFDFWRQ